MKSVFKQPDDNLSISLGDFPNHWSASHFQCPQSRDMRTTWDGSGHAIQISQLRAGSLCFSGGWLDGGNVDGWRKEYTERGILSPLDTQRIEGLIRSCTRQEIAIWISRSPGDFVLYLHVSQISYLHFIATIGFSAHKCHIFCHVYE